MRTSGPRTYGHVHARAMERPVWLLFLGCGFNFFILLFYFFYGHVLVLLNRTYKVGIKVRIGNNGIEGMETHYGYG